MMRGAHTHRKGAPTVADAPLEVPRSDLVVLVYGLFSRGQGRRPDVVLGAVTVVGQVVQVDTREVADEALDDAHPILEGVTVFVRGLEQHVRGLAVVALADLLEELQSRLAYLAGAVLPHP